MSAFIIYVYVLENPAGRFYIGQSANLPDRLSDHDSPLKRFGDSPTIAACEDDEYVKINAWGRRAKIPGPLREPDGRVS